MPFTPISHCDIPENFFSLIGEEWMLVCAGTPEDNNAMTASWGQIGNLWNRPVATCYVKPERHTFGYMNAAERFTLNFFEPGTHRRELEVMGSHSGRDIDKNALAELAVAPFGPHRAPGYQQAALVLVCRTLYRQDLEAGCFLDPALPESVYPEGRLHRMFIGEVEQTWRQR